MNRASPGTATFLHAIPLPSTDLQGHNLAGSDFWEHSVLLAQSAHMVLQIDKSQGLVLSRLSMNLRPGFPWAAVNACRLSRVLLCTTRLPTCGFGARSLPFVNVHHHA